jgi:hypothetical protein
MTSGSVPTWRPDATQVTDSRPSHCPQPEHRRLSESGSAHVAALHRRDPFEAWPRRTATSLPSRRSQAHNGTELLRRQRFLCSIPLSYNG